MTKIEEKRKTREHCEKENRGKRKREGECERGRESRKKKKQ